jgi:hypothetical protein
VSLDPLRWGLIPYWCQDPKGGRKPINAKCETVRNLPTFRDAYRRRRCIVPVDGFFEWKAIKGQKAKQPYAIAMKDGSPFGLGGLWENWKEPASGEWIRTFAVITTDANESHGLHRSRRTKPKSFRCWGVTSMTKRNHDLLRDLLDELTVTPIYAAACARCGVSPKSLWRYVRASQRENDPERYCLIWCDVEDWFHDHVKQAMRMSAVMIEGAARHHALHGFDEVQVFQGKVCWKEDPRLAGLSDDDLARLGQADRYERNPDGSLIPLTVRRKPSDQLVLKMLSAHFPQTYGEKVAHQHSGIIGVMRMGRDGKMRPNSQTAPELDDQSDELVVSADSGNVVPSQMKIGLVVGEPCNSEELERLYGGPQSIPDIEFVEDDTVTPMEADGAVTAVKSPEQETAAPAASEQAPAPARRDGAA